MSVVNQIRAIKANEIPSLIPVFFQAKRTPMFVGKPGCAKTAMVREGGKELGRFVNASVKVYECHLASMSEVDIRGYLIPNGDQATFTKPPFWRAVEENEYGILFLDEFPQATHEVQKAVAPLILDRRIGDYELPPGWMVVLAGNSIEDNSGANTLLAHVLNRIFYQPVNPPDVEEWATWAAAEGLPPEQIAFAMLRPQLLTEPVPDAPDTPFCTFRSMEALGRVANAYPGGLVELCNEHGPGLALMAGSIGIGAAGELAGVVRQTMRLPRFEDAMRDPEGTPVPTQPSEAYAMAMLVAVRADGQQHKEQAAQYLLRFAPNVCLIGLIALVRRDKAFLHSKAFSKWVIENRELVRKFQKFLTVN